MLSRILRLVSLAICLIAVASFVTFALEQSKSASAHQQNELNSSAPPSQQTAPVGESSASAKRGAFHEAVDEAFSKLSSPFSGLTSGIGSQWTLHAANTLLALLIYGFGLGFLARRLRLGAG